MSFDTLAPFYQTMEFLSAGGKLQRCRVAFLDEIPRPGRILLAGEGHGKSLPEFRRSFPEAGISVLDGSMRMLEISRRSLEGEEAGVEFIHADILEWEGSACGYDLIVTNFFLDCFREEELERVVGKLAACATAEADWLLADFEIPGKGLARWRSRLIVKLLYGFFRVVCGLKADSLVPPDGMLERNGFARMKRVTRDAGMLKSEWWRREC